MGERVSERGRASVYVFNDSLIINKIVFGPQPSSHIYSLTAATMAKRNNFVNEPIQDSFFSAWI